jgi:hypothetical protein
MLVCPNNKGRAIEEEEQPKPKRGKKSKAAVEAEAAAETVKCDYSRPIPPPEAVA